MTRAALIACLLLAGCGGVTLGPVAQNPQTGATGIELETDQDGLAIFGSGGGTRIDFGRAPSGVIAALERELGPGRDLGTEGCAAGITRQIAWGDLILTFTDEQFVGWRSALAEAGYTCGTMA